MKDITQKGKVSQIISGLSVMFSLLGVTIALINLRFLITNGRDTWGAVRTLLIGVPIFLFCIAQFITIRNKYKKKSK